MQQMRSPHSIEEVPFALLKDVKDIRSTTKNDEIVVI